MRGHGWPGGVAAALAMLCLAAAPARAVTTTSMTMFGDTGLPGVDHQHVFTPANTAVTLHGDGHRLEVDAQAAGTDYDVELIRAPGQGLQPGVYTASHRTSLVGPPLRVAAEGFGCSWYTRS